MSGIWGETFRDSKQCYLPWKRIKIFLKPEDKVSAHHLDPAKDWFWSLLGQVYFSFAHTLKA